MRIVEWNCQGAFRRKNKKILDLKPDILIVPECENGKRLEFGKSTPVPSDFFWHGDNESKGVGIFSYSDYRFELLKEFNPDFRYVISLKVSNREGCFLLFAVWAMDNKEDPSARYIAQVWLALDYYSHLLNLSVIFAGDFNSNKMWDAKERYGNHSDVVAILGRNKIHSLYHAQRMVEHGDEDEHTFFMYRKKDKPYHIDYCFASEDFYDAGMNLRLGEPEEWLEFSDHVPLIIEANCPPSGFGFDVSLYRYILQKLERLNPVTIDKFMEAIEKLKNKASRYDLDNLGVEERMSIVRAMSRLAAIDRRVRELTKDGYM